jgi:para-nitrobenzyl esterase
MPRALTSFSIAALLFLAFHSPSFGHPADEVTVESGKLQGTMNADHSVRLFRGIPFAAPPVGDLR